jgi:hypothetical protein
MAQALINTGTFPNDQTGDPALLAFQKINGNFTQLFSGSGAISNLVVSPGSITINRNTAAVPAVLANISFLDNGADALGNNLAIYSYASNGSIDFFRADGTGAVPTALVNADLLGAINFGGFGTSFPSAGVARTSVRSSATENWSGTSQGASLAFLTTPNGTISAVQRVLIDNDGTGTWSTPSTSSNLNTLTLNSQVNGSGATLNGAAGSGTALQMIDGNTGNRVWQVRNGYIGVGIFDIADISAAASRFQINATGNAVFSAASLGSGPTLTINGLNSLIVQGAAQFDASIAVNGATPTAALNGFGTPAGTVTANLSSASTLTQVAGTLAGFLAYMKTIGFIAA